MSEGKNIVLGVTGSIAAYKAAELTSLLTKQGCDVRVVLTADALRFITAVTFKTLSRHPVVTDLYDEEEGWQPTHIKLADEANLLLIAPAFVVLVIAQRLESETSQVAPQGKRFHRRHGHAGTGRVRSIHETLHHEALRVRPREQIAIGLQHRTLHGAHGFQTLHRAPSQHRKHLGQPLFLRGDGFVNPNVEIHAIEFGVD